MPNSTNGTGQTPPASQSPDSNGQTPPTSQDATTADSSDATNALSHADWSTDDYETALRKARDDAKKIRVDGKELAELRAFKEQQEAAKLTDAEKRDQALAAAEKRAADAEERAQRVAVTAEAKIAANALGIKTELALKLLDFKDIEFDEDGDPKNVAKLLRAAADEYGITMASSTPTSANGQQPQAPYVSSGGAVNPSRTSNSNNGLFDGDPQTVMKRVSKLAPSEYAARATEIQAFMAANWNKISGR